MESDQDLNLTVSIIELWVDSDSKRNEYQEYFLGVKPAGA